MDMLSSFLFAALTSVSHPGPCWPVPLALSILCGPVGLRLSQLTVSRIEVEAPLSAADIDLGKGALQARRCPAPEREAAEGKDSVI